MLARLGLAVLLCLGSLLATTSPASAQRLSPPDSSSVEIAGRQLKVVYGSPSVRDRVIFGGLIPWNEVWRTGANEATSFSSEANLRIGGAEVPAGHYTLYTIPNADEWTLIINRQNGQWGTEYHTDMDLARVTMDVDKLSESVERFRIALEAGDTRDGELVMEWATTRASVPIEVLP
jgi:hypothetical protein